MTGPFPGSNTANAVHQIIKQRDRAKKNAVGWVLEEKRATAELAQIVNPEAHLVAVDKMKGGGSTTVSEYGAKFTVEAEKDVKWDSGALQNIAARMPWVMVEQYFKIKFEMTETQFKNAEANAKSGALDPQVFALMKQARTVTIKEAKITKAEIIT